MQKNTFWLVVLGFFSLVLVGNLVAIMNYDMDVNSKIEAAIKAGVDPIKATCAFDYHSYKAVICGIAISK